MPNAICISGRRGDDQEGTEIISIGQCRTGHNLRADAVRSRQIGKPVHFGSTFGFQTQLGNHRVKAGHWGEVLPDIGVYCLNAARHVFAAEPVAAQAKASRPNGDAGLAKIDCKLTVTLKFPGERLAQVFCSFGSGTSQSIRIGGSNGELILDPAFKFGSTPRMTIRTEGKEETTPFDQVDPFAGQIAYSSDSITSTTRPEADGEEGLADMRALLAIEEAARTDETIRLDPSTFKGGMQREMLRSFAPTTKRRLLWLEPRSLGPF